MKVLTVNFPSVLETTFGSTENSSKDLLNGLKVKKEDTWYMVGNLAKRAGVNPNHLTNASPQLEDYEILFKSAMLSVASHIEQPVAVTMGFPFSTYSVYKAAAEQFLSKRHFLAEYDTQTYNVAGSVKRTTFDIDNFDVIPEIVGCVIGLKKMSGNKPPGNFIAISLGFGTIEGGMATEEGLVHRTCFSSYGLQYAIDNLSQELNKRYYLKMKNVHQLDDAFRKGSIFINREKIDLKGLRKNILNQYYREVIFLLLNKYFTDQDFEICEKIYLMGGGAHYPELVEAFQNEFKGSIEVEVAPEPEKLASIGYLYNSFRISDGKQQRSVGIDIGNSSTTVSVFQEKETIAANKQ